MTVLFYVLVSDGTPLAIALVIAGAWALIPAGRRRVSRLVVRPVTGGSPSVAASGVILGAAALIMAFSAPIQFALSRSGLVASPAFEYTWWEYAPVLLLACAALAVTLLVLTLGRRKPEVPVPPLAPRSWRTYLDFRQLRIPGVALAGVILLVAFAGSISSQDDEGRYRWLVVESGGENRAATTFFGWAYGLPVLAGCVVLGVLAFCVLSANAARPFQRPESVPADEGSRRAISLRTIWVVSGALLLTLGRSVSRVAGSALMTTSNSGHSWGTDIAALAPWLSWVAGFLTVTAYILLLLVVGTTRFRPAPPLRVEEAQAESDPARR